MDYWRPIFADKLCHRYLVSRNGEIWSVVYQKMMKSHLKGGYLAISLTDGIQNITFNIHRIVAITFLLCLDFNLVVNHINGNKIDNRVENLEWITQKDNVIHAVTNGLIKPYTKSVIQYDINNNKIAMYKSIQEAAKIVKCDASTISRVCKGEYKTAGGFIWRYENDYDGSSHYYDGTGRIHPKYPGYYVLSDGRIYGIKRRRYLKPQINLSGYSHVTISNNGIGTEVFIHIIVAELYLSKIPGKNIVNHKNSMRADNRVENLEWCTSSENSLHSYNNGRKISTRVVKQFSRNGEFIISYESAKIASTSTAIGIDTIRSCCQGKSKSAGGFIWTY